jgi:membrane protein implicated in regulation of membrane protease activity
MDWWIWLVLGIALLGAEMLAPGGLYLLFAGVAALFVGVLVLGNVVGSIATQWLLFALIAGASVFTLRGRLAASMSSRGLGDNVVGETIELTTTIEPDGVGKALLRGSTWNVHNAGSHPLDAGTRCRVDAVEGVTLTVGRSGILEEAN